jgi:hypothetical protein
MKNRISNLSLIYDFVGIEPVNKMTIGIMASVMNYLRLTDTMAGGIENAREMLEKYDSALAIYEDTEVKEQIKIEALIIKVAEFIEFYNKVTEK